MTDLERLDELELDWLNEEPIDLIVDMDDLRFLFRLARHGIVYEQIAKDEREPALDLDETKENETNVN